MRKLGLLGPLLHLSSLVLQSAYLLPQSLRSPGAGVSRKMRLRPSNTHILKQPLFKSNEVFTTDSVAVCFSFLF